MKILQESATTRCTSCPACPLNPACWSPWWSPERTSAQGFCTGWTSNLEFLLKRSMKILRRQKASFLSRWTKAWVKGGIKLLKIFLFCHCLQEINFLSQAIEGGRQPNPPLVLLSPLNLQFTPDINQSCISGLFHSILLPDHSWQIIEINQGQT